jgi:crotonobetainyl-CoA:carnitine CoA-transferase CaiB-like acyl-CoA transferase
LKRERGGGLATIVTFSGLTVVDVATLNAAPQIAAFFGDFGARVIKVEHPRGDSLRRLVDARGDALQWKLTNRNKECVTLDLARAEGRALLARMLDRADLLVAGMSRGRLARWQLAPEDLAARHPRLVVVNLTAYGNGGPWSERPGSGTLAEAMSGLAALTGPPDGPPTLSPVGLGDYLGVLQGIIAALVGLYARDAGSRGRGEALDVAMYEPLLGLLSQRLAAVARDGVEPTRTGNRFPTMAPRNAYPTSDGEWVAITAGTDDLVRRLFAAIGAPDLIDDPRFRDNAARVASADDLDEIVGSWIAARTRDQVVAALNAAGVSAAAVDGLRRVLRNDHFRARGSLVEAEDEGGERVVVAAPSPVRETEPGRIRWLGRVRGADNDRVYREWLGLTSAEVADLVRAGVV